MANSEQNREDKDITNERRKHPRVDCSEATFFASEDAVYEGLIKDIGAKGVYVASGDPVEVGEVITIAIPSAGNKQGKKIQGEVIWKKPGGFGIRFTSHVLRITVNNP
ncbi:MAG: PilZ domain-containing protein [Desulfatiglans sp.]|jgi:hypothetical protein|nr:PilZ domain-containing protein [Thermodesulfobacteriota bacterium]MEE4353696.1 PilZ domain-containing protein [Desulfatiglans sp.]